MLMQCFVHVKSQFRGKITGSSIEKFPFLVLPRNTTTVTAPYYPISSQLSVSGRLWEVKNKRKFQTFSSKSGRGRPREAVAYKRCPMQWFGRKTFLYFGKLVAYERWSQLEVRLYSCFSANFWLDIFSCIFLDYSAWYLWYGMYLVPGWC